MDINHVELSGEISEIRVSERGSNFVVLKQNVKIGEIEKVRFFETLISAEKTNLISQLEKGKRIKVIGFLTIFKVKKFNIYKMLVDVEKIEQI